MAKEARVARDRRRRRTGRGGLARLINLAAFLPVAGRAPDYARLVWALVRDERIPPARKALLAAAAGYLVVGKDIVPDELPLLGGLDDVVIVVLAVDLFLDGVPRELLHEKCVELGIDERAFEEDLVRIRKLMPGPVRRVVRRLPGAIATAGDAVRRSGIAPRIRGWIDKEESFA